MNIQKKILSMVIAGSLLVPGIISARAIVPSPAKFAKDPPEYDKGYRSMFIASAGVLAGGKQNSCYLLRSRLMIKKISLDASMYYHFSGDRLNNGDKLYTVNLGLGGLIQFTAGVEFGDRRYYVNADSTLEHIKFKNVATGQYEPYSSFTNFTMPEDVVSYNIGVNMGGRFKMTNYWRGVGECLAFVSIKWELMYAPTIGYSKTLDIVTQGPYQADIKSYELEGTSVRHFGFRLLFDSRMGSKIGWLMEVGMRPGIRYEINEENRFSNGYVRMGVVIGISVGGRKDLHKAGFGREIPEN